MVIDFWLVTSLKCMNQYNFIHNINDFVAHVYLLNLYIYHFIMQHGAIWPNTTHFYLVK